LEKEIRCSDRHGKNKTTGDLVEGGIDVFESKVAEAEQDILSVQGKGSERNSYIIPMTLNATMGVRSLHNCKLNSKGILMRPAASVARKSRSAIRN